MKECAGFSRLQWFMVLTLLCCSHDSLSAMYYQLCALADRFCTIRPSKPCGATRNFSLTSDNHAEGISLGLLRHQGRSSGRRKEVADDSSRSAGGSAACRVWRAEVHVSPLLSEEFAPLACGPCEIRVLAWRRQLSQSHSSIFACDSQRASFHRQCRLC